MPQADHAKILEQSEVRFGYRIAVLANWYRGPGYKLIEQRHGITEPECSVLFCVGHSNELTATDVCHITGRPRNSMSRAIHILLRKKLMARESDPGDARRKILRLTKPGYALYRQIVPVFVESERNMLTPLSLSEISDLDRLLTKMIAHTSQSHKIY
ncbi:MAG: MarR family winged helix-turn-helix transcriptional regulator [Proteobacteria bacterium]|nr:MarR family winged helix-turn-helix transcriptional regulator [Pseudomonadota bacterium]